MKRIQYVDLLRIFATLGVIHVHSTYKCDLSTCYSDWILSCVRDCTPRWIIPIFVMISGIFMLDPNKNITIKNVWSKRILRLFSAYVVWWLIYSLFSVSINYACGNSISLANFVPFAHLWFLPMMMGVYIILPILRLINADKKVAKYFLIVWFITTSIEFFLHFAGYPMDKIRPLYFIYFYSGYMFLGYYLFHGNFSIHERRLVYLCGFLAFLVAVGGTIALSKFQSNSLLFTQNIGPCIVLMSVMVFCMFKDLFMKERQWATRLIEYVNKDLFGIYLVHLIWVEIYMYLLSHLGINWILLTFIVSLLTFVSSLYMVKLIRRIPYLHKIVE